MEEDKVVWVPGSFEWRAGSWGTSWARHSGRKIAGKSIALAAAAVEEHLADQRGRNLQIPGALLNSPMVEISLAS